MRARLAACLLWPAVGFFEVSAQTACDAPDTTNAKCTCNGQEYDFSQIQPSDGNSYFSGPDANNEYMYYFQMTGGGLPADDGAMPYCTFGAGVQGGNAAGQGEITGTSCFPIGQVTQQQWTIDTTQNPQVIQITFSGGQEGRQSVLSVTCDPSADSPTFSVKGETRTLVYEMDVTSKYACGGGGPPSPGPPSPGPPSPGPPSPGPPSPGPPSPGPPSPGPPPTPPPPQQYFRCVDNNCTLATQWNGIAAKECDAVCGSDKNDYACKDSQCVVVPPGTGIPVESCSKICKPGAGAGAAVPGPRGRSATQWSEPREVANAAGGALI